jgi:hypothetical protein
MGAIDWIMIVVIAVNNQSIKCLCNRETTLSIGLTCP